MESNEQNEMEDTNLPDEEEVVVFHPDPAVNSIMTTINDKASYYRLAVGVLTGKFDSTFQEWLANPTGVDMGIVENIPSSDETLEWMHLDASLASLLEYKSVLDKLAKELHLAIFGHYAKKNVRGMVHHKLEDLKALREDLINVLNGTVNLANQGIIPSALADYSLIEGIESVGKRKPFGDNAMVWNFPDAPNPERNATDKAAAAAGTNLRKHNSNVKFVVDGKLPESDLTSQLGDLCGKYFGKTTQEVGKLFGGWAKEYFADGDKEPEKAIIRDGVKYWLTYYSK